MPTPKQDRQFIETALPELKTYLLSDILYYPLMGNLPRLTLGGLLLAQQRLGEEKLGSLLTQKLASVKESWRAAWAKKATQELDARLRLWRNYLNDYRADPKANLDNYAHEVKWRVMIELLSAEVDQIPAEIAVLDDLLRLNFASGEFIWDENLQNQFPQDDFWFLYGKVK